MDLNKYSSYLSLDPSALYAAQRLVERVVRYHGEEYEDMVQELEESLHGKTLEYAMELFEEAIAEGLEYMGVKIAFNGKTYSAPTVGLYGVKSKPEIKAGIKAKVLARNEREQKEEYEVSLADKKGNTQAYKNYKAGMKNKLTGKPLYKAGKGVEEALDPVGQEDGDVNNDGKKDKTDKYLKNRRRAISKAIAAKEEHEIEALVDYFVTEQIAKSPEELDEIMFEIDEEHTEYFLEKAMELKGKKKGNVIINPKTEKMQEEEQSGQEKTQLANQKRMMAKKHMMDRQKMALKKQGKLNVNAESVEMVNEVDYSGTPAKNDAESEKAKQYPTFAELKAKLAQAGDPAKGIPADTQLPQTSLKKEEVEQVDENRAAMGRINKEYHRKKEAEAMAAKSRDPKVKRDLPKRKNDNPMYDPKSAGSSRVKGFKFTGEEVEQVDEADTRPENINSPGHRDRSNEGLSDRQIRMKKFAQKRAQMALNKEEVGEVDESAEDRLRDMRQERGGVDGNTNYRKPVKFASGPSKKKYDGMSALDRVKSDIRAKYGKGAIMDTKKK